jgi:hypothetical protein
VAWGAAGSLPANLTNVMNIAVGGYYCTAVKADGRVVTWGDNSYGQTNVPANLTNAIRIAAGYYHALAVRSDGTVSAGDTSLTVPSGFTNVIAVGSGFYNNLALEGDSPPLSRAPLLNPGMDTNGFKVSVPTESGHVYRLEYKTSLSDPQWTPLPLAAGNGGMLTLIDTAPTDAQRVYRVRRW